MLAENEDEVLRFYNFAMCIYARNKSTTTSKNKKSQKLNTPDHIRSEMLKNVQNGSLTEKLEPSQNGMFSQKKGAQIDPPNSGHINQFWSIFSSLFFIFPNMILFFCKKPPHTHTSPPPSPLHPRAF
jgi:hypothetical protein